MDLNVGCKQQHILCETAEVLNITHFWCGTHLRSRIYAHTWAFML